MYEVLLTDHSIRDQIEKIVVASPKSVYGEGAYRCEDHVIIYPESRDVANLKRK